MTHPQENSQGASQGVARASGVSRHLPKSKRSEPGAPGAKEKLRSRKVASTASAAPRERGARPRTPTQPRSRRCRTSELLEIVQRQTFRYFWEGAHPDSGLAFDRRTSGKRAAIDARITIGGSGFGVMALIVAAERGWVTRGAALERLGRMLELLARARRYHGAYPHFMNGQTGETIPFSAKDDAADLVETSFLMMGLLCARQYFDRDTPRRSGGASADLEPLERRRVELVHARRARCALLALEPDARLGDGSRDSRLERVPDHLRARGFVADVTRSSPSVYHQGFASGPGFRNGKSWYGIELPLGMPYGGPLFFAHYSFFGLDPRGLADRYADYWEQNARHVRINRAHCIANPGPIRRLRRILLGSHRERRSRRATPRMLPTTTTARSARPRRSRACRMRPPRSWPCCGISHAARQAAVARARLCRRVLRSQDWYADTFLAIDQGPIIVMIENHRTGLLWKLFMSVPEVQAGLRRLGFSSPHLERAEK